MRWGPDGPIPTDMFEAALGHYAVKPVCKCGHSCTFDPHGLWWHFQTRRWNDSFASAKRHFWCRICTSRTRRRVRAIRIEYVKWSEADFQLPLPPEHEWKRAVRRVRS